MKDKKQMLGIVIGLFIITIIYIILVKTINVEPIGPKNSEVGFAAMNNYFHTTLGESKIWYNISKIAGYLPFLFIVYYGIIGLKQLIEKKDIRKVDKKILILGFFYILVGLTYILFEKVIINYRPVLENGELEASFPSSHTMLALCICLSTVIMNKWYIKNEKTKKYLNIGTIILMILIVVSRTLSGVHWMSDIIGGIIISVFLTSIFYAGIVLESNKE